MCRFIETICLNDGDYPLLELHQQRVNRAFAAHFPGIEPHNLTRILPRDKFPSKYKVRVVYDAARASIEFTPYVSRTVNAIQMVREDAIDYAHKYEDRSELQRLFELREGADEILIIKNGLVTDCFYANPAFWDGSNWYAPTSCLLHGVRRIHLINTGKVELIRITERDISSFEKISLVNALLDLDECSLPIRAIK